MLKFVLTSSTVNAKLNKLKTDKVPLLGHDYLPPVCFSCFDLKVNYCNSFKVFVYLFHVTTGTSADFPLCTLPGKVPDIITSGNVNITL